MELVPSLQVGFRLVETLAQQAGCSVDKQQHQALVGRGILWSHRVLLAKPTTFMNLSGKAVVALAQYYKVRIPLSAHACSRVDHTRAAVPRMHSAPLSKEV